MSDSFDPKITAALFDAQLAALKDAASTTVEPCLVAKYIALVDTRVRTLFLNKLAAGYVFRSITCIDRVGIPENKYVVFDFDCKPGTFCLVDPSFMVIVNIIDRYVVAIVDPYIPTTFASPAESCGCGQGNAPASVSRLRGECIDVTISDGEACLNIPYAGRVCISVPNSVPNGTVAEACIDTCSRHGIVCGAEVSVRVAGVEVASDSWGCC